MTEESSRWNSNILCLNMKESEQGRRFPIRKSVISLLIFLIFVIIGILAIVIINAGKNKAVQDSTEKNENNTYLSPECVHKENPAGTKNGNGTYSSEPNTNKNPTGTKSGNETYSSEPNTKTYIQQIKDEVKNASNICMTLDCITEASNLMNSMDLNVDPCTDFYSFACGNWIRNAHLLTKVKSQFTVMHENVIFRVKDMLESSGGRHTPLHQRLTKMYYEVCMDDDTRDNLGARELLGDLKVLGGWPLIDKAWNMYLFDWADLMVKLFQSGYQYNMFFSVSLVKDPDNAYRSILKLDLPTLGLSNRKYYSDDYEEFHDRYKEAIFKLARKLNNGIDEMETRADIKAAFEIEMLVAQMSTVSYGLYEENTFQLKDLAENLKSIPLMKILKGILPQDTKLSGDDRLYSTIQPMLEGLNELIKESGPKAIANYMMYRAVFFAASDLSRDFYDIVYDVADLDKYGWLNCLTSTMVWFEYSITSSYVKQYVKKESKEAVDYMVHNLRKSLVDVIKKSNWMDRETKKYAVVKVQSMKQAILYMDEMVNDTVLNEFYSDTPITNNHFENSKRVVSSTLQRSLKGLRDVRKRASWDRMRNLMDANAFYYLQQNSFLIPVGILHDTMFAPNRPNYVNYGCLGTIVSHELGHAFDSYGSLFDAEGKMRMWWTTDSWTEYTDKTQCFRRQYSNFKPIPGYNIDGSKTLRENIADNGGIETAYQAYTKLLGKIKSEKQLPGLPYNEKQMFWISFASVWCKKQTYESTLSSLLDEHAISKYRVIGSLSNMKEFSEDFNCKLHTRMNPINKCTLWT